MAFVDPTQPGEDENNQNPSQVDQVLKPSSAQQQSQTQTPPTTSGGGGVASAGGGSGAPAAPAAPKPSSSGSWTNLDSYLNANNDQATSMGQQIAQSVNNVGTKAQNDISNLGSGFTSAVKQHTVDQNPDAVAQAIKNATSLTAGSNLSSEDQQAFNAQANADYAGPKDVTSFDGYSQTQQDVNAANQAAKATQSEAGRGSLLKDQYGNASQYGYTQGETNLDQLLLQNSEGAKSALNPLADKWSSLNGALNNTVSTGGAQVQQATNTNQATSAAAKNSLGTATQDFQTKLNAGLATLQQTDTDAYNKIVADLQSGNLSPEELALTGINQEDHNYLQKDQLGQYLNQSNAPTISNFANADQYAQAAALAELAGQSSSNFLAPGSASQAGTAQTTPAYNFDTAKYGSDQKTAQAEYTSALGDDLNQINGLPVTISDTNGNPTTWTLGGQNPFTSVKDAVAWADSMLTRGAADVGQGYVDTAFKVLQMLNKTQNTYNFPGYTTSFGKDGNRMR